MHYTGWNNWKCNIAQAGSSDSKLQEYSLKYILGKGKNGVRGTEI